jgi:hypothetical protein
MIGMHNIVVHDYADVDLSLVWKTVREDLPRTCQATERDSRSGQRLLNPSAEPREGHRFEDHVTPSCR